MANVVKDYGLKALYCYGGLPFPVQTYVALSAASVLMRGDPVIFAGDGDISGRPSIDIAIGSEGTESPNIIGVVVSVQASGPDSLLTHAGATGSARIVQVCLALPYVVFQVNASNTTGANSADLGNNFDLVLTAGDTLTGRSQWALDMGEDAQAGATTTNQMRLIGFANRPDNEQAATGTDTPNIACLATFRESGVVAVAGNGI